MPMNTEFFTIRDQAGGYEDLVVHLTLTEKNIGLWPWTLCNKQIGSNMYVNKPATCIFCIGTAMGWGPK